MDRSHRCDLYIPCTLQGTNMSPTKALLKMIILFPFDGMICDYFPGCYTNESQKHHSRELDYFHHWGPVRASLHIRLQGLGLCFWGPLPGALVVLVPTVGVDLSHEGHGPLVERVEGSQGSAEKGLLKNCVSLTPTGRLLAYDLNAVSCQILELWYQAMMPWYAAVGTKFFFLRLDLQAIWCDL